MSTIIDDFCSQEHKLDISLPLQKPMFLGAYFFNGSNSISVSVDECVNQIFDELKREFQIKTLYRFQTKDSRDWHHIKFEQYEWSNTSSESSFLMQAYIKSNQIWCIQFVQAIREKDISLDKTLRFWRDTSERVENLINAVCNNYHNEIEETIDLYWGSTRLYWVSTDAATESLDISSYITKGIQEHTQSLESKRRDSQNRQVESSPNRSQKYTPQCGKGGHGQLWRLDEPALDREYYEADWLLVSFHKEQSDFVTQNYVLNGRFALGESYLCKARHQIKEYKFLTDRFEESMSSTRDKTSTLLERKLPVEFGYNKIDDAQKQLIKHKQNIHEVSKSYSPLLFYIPDGDRLHLTIETNLTNYKQTEVEFKFWHHPAVKIEISELQGFLRQIEHDQVSRKASLQSFQAAIETARANLELTDNQIALTLLKIEQEEAIQNEIIEKRNKLVGLFIAVIGIFLSASQLVVLTSDERWETALWGAIAGIVYLIYFFWWKK